MSFNINILINILKSLLIEIKNIYLFINLFKIRWSSRPIEGFCKRTDKYVYLLNLVF